MKRKITCIPSNYRKLKPHEVLRNGDLYANVGKNIYGILDHLESATTAGWTNSFSYYRRCHGSTFKKELFKNTDSLVIKTPEVGKQVIKISAKCSDLFSASLVRDGKTVGDYSGYVPDFFPGQHFGDYVELNIDVATGQILNWKTPSKKELGETFEQE